MNQKSIACTIVIAFILIGLGQLAWHYNALPQQVASHFNAAGEPDGFSSKTSYVLLQLALVLGLPAIMMGSGLLAKFLPPSMVNMPNREYWLADERRNATLDIMQTFMAWITAATQIFMAAIAQLAFDANMRGGKLASLPTTVLIVVYLLGIGGFIVYLYIRFRLPEEAKA